MHILKKLCGKYYADGIQFETFRDALAYIWNER